MKNTEKFILLTTSFFNVVMVSYAQKLPNKQETGIYAPANIKIDGKATEWNDVYQAHNNATEMSYTISNDDQNLYLVAYITSPTAVFFKAMKGGITFIIKNNSQQISIRYPAFGKNMPSLVGVPKREVLSGKDDDPIIVKDNAAFTDKAKEMEVIGINGVDTLIAIYNEYGLKAAGHFDAKLGYTYELAIPLKHLGLSADAGSKFNYQILLNGGISKYSISSSNMIGFATSFTHPDGTPGTQAEVDEANENTRAYLNAKYATTDFAGEYTLAKKP